MYAAQPLKVWPQSVRLRTLPSWSQKERACIFSRKSVATGFVPDSVSVYTLFNPSLNVMFLLWQVKQEPSFYHPHFLPLVNTPKGRLYYLQNSVENQNAGRVPIKNQGVNFPFPYPEQKGNPQRVTTSIQDTLGDGLEAQVQLSVESAIDLTT